MLWSDGDTAAEEEAGGEEILLHSVLHTYTHLLIFTTKSTTQSGEIQYMNTMNIYRPENKQYTLNSSPSEWFQNNVLQFYGVGTASHAVGTALTSSSVTAHLIPIHHSQMLPKVNGHSLDT